MTIKINFSKSFLVAFMHAFLVVGCTHPIEIEGQGDVMSATGERDCAAEQERCAFQITGEYFEAYTANPRAGWEFASWSGCGDGSDTCTFGPVPASVVEDNWFKTMPANVASFSARVIDNPTAKVRTVELYDDSNEGIDTLSCTKDALISPDGRFAYVPSSCDEAVNIFSRDVNSGTLDFMEAIIFDDVTGVGLSSINAAALSPEGDHLYVAGRTGIRNEVNAPGGRSRNAILVYERDEEDGTLRQIQAYDGQALGFISQLLMAANGQQIYVGSTDNDGLLVLDRFNNGTLAENQFIEGDTIFTARTLSVNDGSATWVALSPDESILYAGISLHSTEEVIAWFDRGVDGSLSLIDFVHSMDDGFSDSPDYITTSSDARHLYALIDESIWHYNIDEDGGLSFASSVTEPPENVNSQFFCIETLGLSPNNQLMYFGDGCSPKLYIYSRDQESGELSFLNAEVIPNNSGFERLSVASIERIHFANEARYAYVPRGAGVSVFDLSADLELSLRGPNQWIEGDTARLSLDVFNGGSSFAHNLLITLELEGNIGSFDVVPGRRTYECTSDESTVTCVIEELAKAANADFDISIEGVGLGDIQLSATVVASQADPNAENNGESLRVTYVPEEE